MAGRFPRGIAKWSLLTVLALVAGGSLGAAVKLQYLEADGEPLTDHEMRRGDIWPPTAPILTSPEDGALVPTLHPEFTWEASEDNRPRLIYVLEFSTDPKFRDGVLMTVSNIEETRWQPPEDSPFAPGVTIYWRAYSIDEGLNQSPFSETWAFTPLGAEAPEPPAHALSASASLDVV